MSRLENLPPVQRRSIALAILVVVVLTISAAVAWPFAARFSHYRQAMDDLEFRLKRYYSVASGQEPLQQQVEALRQRWQEGNYLIATEAPALASAQLQQQISQLVAEYDGQLQSTQVLPVTTENDLSRVAIRVRMVGTVETLQGVLRDLEAARPLLLVENLQVRRKAVSQRRLLLRRSRGEEELHLLDIGFNVAGYMQSVGS